MRPQRPHAHEGCCDIRFVRSGAQSEAQSSSSTAMAYDTNGVIGDFAMGDVERQYALAGPCENGLRSLVGVSYSKRRFERLLFGPCSPFTGGVEVENCKFISCSTDSTFSVAHGVRMRHVLFDDVRAPDAMLVSSATVLQDVIIRGGKKAAALWCKPPSHGDVNDALLEWSKAEMANVKLAIDFSELSARDSEVVGIPLSKLRWNPEIHIPVSLSWRESAHWDELELSPRSFWRINLLRLQDFNCPEGVFTVPFPGDRNFDLKMDELARIEDAGILRR